jgi:hypothetical protein
MTVVNPLLLRSGFFFAKWRFNLYTSYMKKFNRLPNRRTILMIAGALFTLMLVLAGGKFWYMHRQGDFYAGKITEISDNIISLQSRDNSERSIQIQPETKVKGRVYSSATPFNEGQYVIVVGKESDNNFINAQIIHILKHD